ncbi:hypothetical protein BH23PLA1_BH23PLA1_03600 [soil metagenome]
MFRIVNGRYLVSRATALILLTSSALAQQAKTQGPAERAQALLKAERYAEVVALLKGQDRAEEVDPAQLGPLAEAYLELGRYEEAEHALDLLQGLDQGPDTLNRLARLAAIKGNTDAALKRMDEAVEARAKILRSTSTVEGANALAADLTRHGQLALEAGKLDLALERFRMAIQLVNAAHMKLHEMGIPHDEGDPRMYAGMATDGLARVYAAMGDDSRAERTWRNVVGRANDPAVLVAYGDFLMTRGDSRLADRIYERAVQLAEGKPEHRRTLARFYADQGKNLDQALALAEGSLQGRDDIEGHDTLAWVRHRRGEHEQAIEPIEKALRTGTNNPRILYHAGMIYQATGRTDEARKHLERALQVHQNFDPRDAQAARNALANLK